jgi:hypothetical protein
MVKWDATVGKKQCMGDTWKVTGELLTKQEMRILLHTKNMYILKQLLNMVTAGIEALVSEYILTPSINSSLLKHCAPNQFCRWQSLRPRAGL